MAEPAWVASIIHLTDLHLHLDDRGEYNVGHEDGIERLLELAYKFDSSRWRSAFAGLSEHRPVVLRALERRMPSVLAAERARAIKAHGPTVGAALPIVVIQTGDIEAYGGSPRPGGGFRLPGVGLPRRHAGAARRPGRHSRHPRLGRRVREPRRVGIGLPPYPTSGPPLRHALAGAPAPRPACRGHAVEVCRRLAAGGRPPARGVPGQLRPSRLVVGRPRQRPAHASPPRRTAPPDHEGGCVARTTGCRPGGPHTRRRTNPGPAPPRARVRVELAPGTVRHDRLQGT